MINTSAITALTKSSMEPRSSTTTTNCFLCSSTEKNGEQRYYHDASIGAAAVGEKARLGTKQH